MPKTKCSLNIKSLVLFSLFALVLSACSSPPPTEPALPTVTLKPSPPTPTPTPNKTYALPLLDRADVLSKGQTCANLYTAHIDAWNSREVENLEQVYTEDIVHFDAEPLYVGINAVTDMAEGMWHFFPDWEMKAGSTYISSEECLGEWINWNVFDFPEDDPGLEFDLMTVRDGKFSYWKAYYDLKFLDIFENGSQIDPEFLEHFGSVWSEGDPSAVAGLYAEDAVLVDSLFGISLSGRAVISNFADDYFKQFSGVRWDLIHAFAEDYSDQLDEGVFQPQGGVYTITIADTSSTTCDIGAVVLLTPNSSNQILEQSIYYDAESLADCGLVQ